MSDQDTTAPAVNVTIKRVEVTTGDDPDRFIHSLNRAVARGLSAPASSMGMGTTPEERWCRWLAGNIREAALEEMRVRAAVVRAIQVPHCLHCGGLLARPCGCETPGCRPGMAQTAICRSCAGPVPDGLYPCPACDHRPWDDFKVVRVGPKTAPLRITVRRGDCNDPAEAGMIIAALEATGWRIVEETTDGGIFWQDPSDPVRSGYVQAKTILEWAGRGD